MPESLYKEFSPEELRPLQLTPNELRRSGQEEPPMSKLIEEPLSIGVGRCTGNTDDPPSSGGTGRRECPPLTKGGSGVVRLASGLARARKPSREPL